MKHKILCILLAAATVCSCSTEPATGIDSMTFRIGKFPAYTGSSSDEEYDSGKNSWENGDMLYLVLQGMNGQTAYRYRLTYSSGWNIVEKYENGTYSIVTGIVLSDSFLKASVYYAPSYEYSQDAVLSLRENAYDGTDEFLEWNSGNGFDVGNGSLLSISFARNYSRIRVASTAGYRIRLNSAGFVPSGYATSALEGLSLYSTADSDGNAFFYGRWAEGTKLEIAAYDTDGMISAEQSYLDCAASTDGTSYAFSCEEPEEDNPGGTGDDEDDEEEDDDDKEDVLVESDFNKVVTVTYSGTSASVSASDVLPATVSGAHVVLGDTSSSVKNVKVVVKGSTANGSLKIYNQKKMLVCLDNASIASTVGPAINSQCGKRCFLLLSGSNSLSDAQTYSGVTEGEDAKGCLFSEGQIIISGTGSLTVNAYYKHGIVSDDYVRIFSGTVTVSRAVSDAIRVNDFYRQDGGTVSLTSSGDGVQCDKGHVTIVGGNLNVNSADDAVSASYDTTAADADPKIVPYISISGGTLSLATTGVKGTGIKAGSDILISGGTIGVTVGGNGSKCLKADNNISISGGNLTLAASGSAYYDTEDRSVCSPCCVRAENICTVSDAVLECKATGKAGKGINCYEFRCNDGADINVSTSGSSYSYSSDYSYAKGIKGSNGVVVNGGKIRVVTTGSGAEGIESKKDLTINGGNIYISAKDDAINAAGKVVFNGGYTFAYSTGNDGIDSNYGRSGAVTFNGGVVMAYSAQSPEEGIDADNHAYLKFSGGTVFSSGGMQGGGGPGGPGGSGQGSNPECSQTTLYFGGSSIKSGYFTVTDASGNVVMAFYLPRAISQNYSFLSSPLLKSGVKYNYGVLSSSPSGATQVWETYFLTGGTATVSSGSFTASGGYQSTSSGGGGGPR